MRELIPWDMTIYDEDHIKNICKPHQGALTCAYLMRGPRGWSCAKRDLQFFLLIKSRVLEGTLRAEGNNCDGWVDPLELAENFLEE